MFRLTLLWLVFLLGYPTISAQKIVNISEPKYRLIGHEISYFIDSENQVTEANIAQQPFTQNKTKVINLEMQSVPVWVKIEINNSTDVKDLTLEIENSNLDDVTFYHYEDNKLIAAAKIGDKLPFEESDRYLNDPFPIFPLKVAKGENMTFYLKVINTEPVILPIYLGSEESITSKIQQRELFFGIYTGVIVVMFLYNLFIFISLRTKMYFLYVVYIFLIFLAQSTFLGYSNKYLFPQGIGFAHIGSFIFPAFVIILGLYFIYEFLAVKTYTHWAKYVFIAFGALCSVSILLAVTGMLRESFFLLQPVAGLSALFIMALSIIHIRMGSRQAKFLLLAWSFFFVGVIVWVLKNLNVLEHNFVTHYAMPIGSALETVLLSFALADRINTLKKEREESQKQMLEEMTKNQNLTKNLNRELEKQVAERTKSLEITNDDLNQTLANLKATQSQLLEVEKMASLGQLTAGIAHEINNPINFVSSNVEPLRQDIGDVLTILGKYQDKARNSQDPELEEIVKESEKLDLSYSIEEIEQLINGIEEGARRTSEIVTGLKNFSRTDEEDLKKSNINDGLKSTITILKSQLRNIKVDAKYGDIPAINCQLGKLNQVFMNIIDNSIDAIHDHWGEEVGGKLTVRTSFVDDAVVISIQDNGKGISEEEQNRIFDPFFTTKDVGEGTGLGLSISYGIVEKHNGHIKVDSNSGEGCKFTITVPEMRKE